MRSPTFSFWMSALIHLLVIFGLSFLLVTPPQFAVQAGHDSVEVDLVAAAPEPVVAPPTPPPPQPRPIPDIQLPEPPKPDDFVVPVTPPAPPPPPVPVPPPPAPPAPPPPTPAPPKPKHTVERGDNSTPKQGHDATTATSDSGATFDTKPDYLSNPPPIYPESARRNKQEGVVVLEVVVSAEGRPINIMIQTSSGFTLLDQSAVTAVHRWRFRPATLAGVKVKSSVTIPVRFNLDD